MPAAESPGLCLSGRCGRRIAPSLTAEGGCLVDPAMCKPCSRSQELARPCWYRIPARLWLPALMRFGLRACYLDEPESQFGYGILEQSLLGVVEIAFRFVFEHCEQIDGVSCDTEVRPGTIFFVPKVNESHGHLGLRFQGKHKKLKCGRRK